MTMPGVTRWGICCTGPISEDFVSALKSKPEYHEVVAVSSRKQETANTFATKFDIENAYEGHDRLAASDKIDIVYIGVIHPLHYEYCKMMLLAGKNVLCEKPLCVNYQQAKKLVDLAREKQVFFMEGMWSRFFPVYHQLRKEIAEGTIGDIKYVQAEMCRDNISKGRLRKISEGGGALLDMGSYPLQLVLMVFGEAPVKVVASGTKTELGTDDTTIVIMHFSCNRMATVTVSTSMDSRGAAVIVGKKGIIEIPDNMWSPTTIITPTGRTDYPLPKCKYPVHLPNSEGFLYEADAVREYLQTGIKESDLITHEESLRLMKLLDTIREQVGVPPC